MDQRISWALHFAIAGVLWYVFRSYIVVFSICLAKEWHDETVRGHVAGWGQWDSLLDLAAGFAGCLLMSYCWPLLVRARQARSPKWGGATSPDSTLTSALRTTKQHG